MVWMENINSWDSSTLLDPARPDTKKTIEHAMEYGVDVKMITGDNVLIAKETARVLGMGTNIRYEYISVVYPEHKYLIVECLRQSGFAVGMTGDGVNDAPALKRADVGVAVQGATVAACAAADIVLTQPGLFSVVEGIIIARCIFQRMKNFINYRIAATLQLLTFFFIAVFALHPADFQHKADVPPSDETEWPEFVKKPVIDVDPGDETEWPEFFKMPVIDVAPGDETEWPEFFKMPVIMLMLITLLNDGALISIGYDNVKPSKYPEKWNLRVTTLVYLKVSVSDFLTLFSARTYEGFFWSPAPSPLVLGTALTALAIALSAAPSPLVLGAALTALAISTVLACIWPEGNTDGILAEGLARGDYTMWALWIWIYCIFWWFVQDSLKGKSL
eukprot:gene4306-14417_t